MNPSTEHRVRSFRVIAIVMIALVIGAVGEYVILRTQISQLTNETISTRGQISESGRMPPPKFPAFAPVSLDSKSTALLLFDFTSSICYRRVSCNATLSNTQVLLAKARLAKVAILFTRVPVNELSNRTGEMVIMNDKGADKFYGTELEVWLKANQVKTAIVAGVSANGAVLYTVYGLSLRGVAVVVVTDGISSDSDYIETYTLFQLLNQPGHSNTQNKPLAPNAVTLSTVQLIQFE